MYLGEWQIDDVLTFTVTTHTFATGALTDADGDPAYRVYEDETGTAILIGTMAKLDDANTTGHYSEQITLSAANGFEVGKTYSIYIAATVSSVTGGAVRSFQVEAAKALESTAQSILADTGTDGVVVAARTVEGAIDEIEALRLLLAALVGKATGGGTATITFRDTGDTKDRIILTVDSSGNRSAATLDAS